MGIARRLKGLAALVALLVIVVGVPWALVRIGSAYLPSSVPTGGQVSQALTSQDTGGLFLTAVVLAAWVAWAVFTVLLLLEVGARLAHRPAPRIKGLRAPQHGVAALVAAAALLFVIGPLAGASHGAPATAAPTPSATAVTASATPGPATSSTSSHATADQAAAPVTAAAAAPTRDYQVRPGDTLWSIAQAQLGDGAQYTQIAQLNYGVAQTDGGALTAAHDLTPGWTLKVPAPAQAAPSAAAAQPVAEQVTVRPGDTLWGIAEQTTGDGADYTDIAAASAATVQPGGQHLTDPAVIQPGWTLTVPADAASAPAAPSPPAVGQTPVTPPPVSTAPAAPAAPGTPPASSAPAAPSTTAPSTSAPTSSAPASSAPAAPVVPSSSAPAPPAAASTAAPAPQAAASVDDGDEDTVLVRTGLGVGAILAAGVLGLVASKRVRQQRRRRIGTRIPMPQGPAADLEQDLRAAADPLSIEIVDRALRTLAYRQAAAGQPLPQVRAARLTADQFELYLAEPAALPAPWAGTSEGNVWMLPADVEDLIDAATAADVAAPYPALVTIGHDLEDGHVLLDLEYIGALAVTSAEAADGQETRDREVLAAIAIELATSQWADDLQVTIVGAYPELEDILETGRIRYLPSAGHIIGELTRRAARDRELLAEDGGDLNHARAAVDSSGLWTPEIVLIAGELTSGQRGQLADLVDELPRVALAAVTSGKPVAEWALRLGADDTAVLDPVGLQLRPQRIDADSYAQMLEVAAITSEDLDSRTYLGPPLPTLQQAADAAAAHGEDDTVEPPVEAVSDVAGPVSSGGGWDSAEAFSGAHAAVGDDADAGVGEELVDEQERGELPDALSYMTRPRHEAVAVSPTSIQMPEPVADLEADSATGVTGDTETVGAAATVDVDERLDPAAADVDLAGADAVADDEPQAAGDPATEDATVPGVDTAADSQQVVAQVMIDQAAVDDVVDPAAEPVVAPAAEVSAEPVAEVVGEVRPLRRRGPRVLILGPVEVVDASGTVEPTKKTSLTEMAAFLALNPGVNHYALDKALYPAKGISDNGRNTATSKLRRWLGKDGDGEDFMPRYNGTDGYRLGEACTTDWQQFTALIGPDVTTASSDALQAAVELVRGAPFQAAPIRRYAWAEQLKEEAISAIVDATYELARRRLMEGRWRATEASVCVGLQVDPGEERLWRARILAAHASGNPEAVAEAVARLTAINDDAGTDLDPETEQLLAQLGTMDSDSNTISNAIARF